MKFEPSQEWSNFSSSFACNMFEHRRVKVCHTFFRKLEKQGKCFLFLIRLDQQIVRQDKQSGKVFFSFTVYSLSIAVLVYSRSWPGSKQMCREIVDYTCPGAAGGRTLQTALLWCAYSVTNSDHDIAPLFSPVSPSEL